MRKLMVLGLVLGLGCGGGNAPVDDDDTSADDDASASDDDDTSDDDDNDARDDDVTDDDDVSDDDTSDDDASDDDDDDASDDDDNLGDDDCVGCRPYPAPGDWPPNHGPGGPARSFEQDELYANCAYLSGGSEDANHHNLVVMIDGYLLMPWAPESGGGGLAFFDVSDPCAPVQVGSTHSTDMRETHSIGFSYEGGRWAVVNQIRFFNFTGGIQFWDIADPTSPQPVSSLELEGFFYPDAYARVVLSVFWQGPYVYVGGADNGLYIVDASDPRHPELVAQVPFEPTLRAGQVQVVGNVLIVSAAEGPRTVLLDISDPADPQPIPGGDFLVRDAEGDTVESYFSNISGGYVYYARKDAGGGLVIYDIHDPSEPTFAGALATNGNGGYVFIKDHFAFMGESTFATVYDISDPAHITEVQRLDLDGDLDTMTPIGNVAVLSVDDESEAGHASAIAPWTREADDDAPRVNWVFPRDGATFLPVTSRFGVTFNEFVDPGSAWAGSVRLYETGTNPAATRVDGTINAQEVVVNFWPKAPLAPGTQYTLELPAGGVCDLNGNPTAEGFTASFWTAP